MNNQIKCERALHREATGGTNRERRGCLAGIRIVGEERSNRKAGRGGYVSPWWLVVYAAPAFAAVVTAVGKARPDPRLACMVFTTFPIMFVVDVAVSVSVVFHGVTGRRIRWMDRRSAASSTADMNAQQDLES